MVIAFTAFLVIALGAVLMWRGKLNNSKSCPIVQLLTLHRYQGQGFQAGQRSCLADAVLLLGSLTCCVKP